MKYFTGKQFKSIYGTQFYKFFRKDLNHYGMQYKVGELNIDYKPFQFFTEQIKTDMLGTDININTLRHYGFAFFRSSNILNEGLQLHNDIVGYIELPDDAQVVSSNLTYPSFRGFKTNCLVLHDVKDWSDEETRLNMYKNAYKNGYPIAVHIIQGTNNYLTDAILMSHFNILRWFSEIIKLEKVVIYNKDIKGFQTPYEYAFSYKKYDVAEWLRLRYNNY